MGMAASQARLLSITARLSDNEMKQQTLTYSKQRLSDNSAQINDQYLEALSKTKYQVLTGYNGVEACYADVSYNNLTGLNSVATGAQYLVKDNSGKVLVSSKLAEAFKKGNGDFNKFLASLGLTQANIDVTNPNAKDQIHNAWDEYLASVGQGINNYNGLHLLDFGYQTFGNKNADDMYNGYPTYDVAYQIQGNDAISVYKDNEGYYTLLTGISSAYDENGNVYCYVMSGNKQTRLENVHYDTETKKYTYKNDDNEAYYTISEEDGSKIWKEFDMLYVNPNNTNHISSDNRNHYRGVDSGEYADEAGNTVTIIETSKALNYEGTTTAQRELYDYAVAITEAYYNNNNRTTTYDAQQVGYYKNIFNQMATCGFITAEEAFKLTPEDANTKLKDANWFVSQLKAGKLTLSYYSTADKAFKGTTLDSDASIVEKEDKSAIAIAEQEYNSKMDKIEHQDKQFDLELNRLESEHNALQTEYDSVKKVISKNVSNSFKTFT
ncbi:MAG: hypothetical protein E7Z87_00055 [Cyanobacteria bacterium SIG26]|nr:hypothetical protein [Cyanobacteria bacterium SIG26]